MDDRNLRAGSYLNHASSIPSSDDIRRNLLKRLDLAGQHAPSQLRLQDIVSTGRAAAEMAVNWLADLEAGFGQ